MPSFGARHRRLFAFRATGDVEETMRMMDSIDTMLVYALCMWE